ncbi:MAG: outer membrane protein assembly factor BamA, partial [Bryobacteraceae bacterium]
MRFNRPWRLWLPLFCACALYAGAPAPQSSPTPQQQQNPFETVPQAPSQPAPAARQPANPPAGSIEAAPAASAAAGLQDTIEAIEFRGARRVPQDTLRSMIFSKVGDRYNSDSLRRDFMALWNTGRFDDITLETEQGKSGIVIRFVVVERQVIRSIKYEGIHAVSTSEILDRFKDKKVGLAVESQYDQNKIQRAAVVLKEFLAERGHQYAEVTPELRQIPPSSLEVTFHVNEGPKVKVGKIQITGNEVFSNAAIVQAMHNSRPYGIPHSILFESLFPKSYDTAKLDEDKEGIRNFYQEHGYWMARALNQTVTMRKIGGQGFHIPLLYPNKPGVRADISVPVEEGHQFTIRNFNYVGVKLLRVPESMTPRLFGMGPGDVFSTAKFRKGMDQMRELYGTFGYIDFVPDPEVNVVPGQDQVDITMSVDEGKQFYVRRIDFDGNTTTRDKVIRRELLLDEGDLFNSKMWEMSIRRLNQLGYFEQLKKEDATQITRDPNSSTVDLTLKVKERGKNTISLTGGVSEIAGSFLGLNYATNNFLGLGETLSIGSQLGTRMRSVTLGFTEPYLFGKPIQTGATVFLQRYSYDQGREASILAGQNLIPYFQSLGANNLINYVSNGRGFTVFASYPLKRSFSRFG